MNIKNYSHIHNSETVQIPRLPRKDSRAKYHSDTELNDAKSLNLEQHPTYKLPNVLVRFELAQEEEQGLSDADEEVESLQALKQRSYKPNSQTAKTADSSDSSCTDSSSDYEDVEVVNLDFESDVEDVQVVDTLEALDKLDVESALKEDNYKILSKVQFFAQFPQDIQKVLFPEFKIANYKDGDLVCKQGEVGTQMHIVLSGYVSVWVTNPDGSTTHKTRVYPPNYFGEYALLYEQVRNANVSAVGDTQVMYLTKQSFQKFEEIRMFLIISKLPLLQKLDMEAQLKIVRRLSPVSFDTGDKVVLQGEKGDAFFMIVSGSAKVVENGHLNATLHEGHTFGHMALLSDKPRIATVEAVSPLICLKLSAQDFKTVVSADTFAALLEEETKRIRRRRSLRSQRRRSDLRSHDASFRSSRSSVSVAKEERILRKSKSKDGKQKINDFVLLESIGRGSFGVVHRVCKEAVEGEQSESFFAMKIVNKTKFKKFQSKSAPKLEELLSEVKILKMLDHQNVLTLVAVIDDPQADYLYIITEICEKGAIFEISDASAAMKIAQSRNYFRQLLYGLSYLHYMSIIHRDIKPMNLFLTNDDVLKIADFGTARVVDFSPGRDDSKRLKDVAGTPAFMAPELLLEENTIADPRAVDIWSCGATLFMFVTGTPPWESKDELMLAEKVKHDELIFPKNYSQATPSPHLKHLIKRMLAKNPMMRPKLLEVMEHDFVTEEGSDPLNLVYAQLPPTQAKKTLNPSSSFRATKKVKRLSSKSSLRGQAMNNASFYRNAPRPPTSPMSAGIRTHSEEIDIDNQSTDSSPPLLKASKSLYTFGTQVPNIATTLERKPNDDAVLSPGASPKDGFVNSIDPFRMFNSKQATSTDVFGQTVPSRRRSFLLELLSGSNHPLEGMSADLLKKDIEFKGITVRYSFLAHPLIYGGYSGLGTRRNQEDRISIVHNISSNLSEVVFFAGLFDGFGGELVSSFIASNLPRFIAKTLPVSQEKLKNAVHKCNETFLRKACRTIIKDGEVNPGDNMLKSMLRTRQGAASRMRQYEDAGSTGVFLTIKGTEDQLLLTYGWVGDSRILLCKNGEAVQLTEDHKASSEKETTRIRANGGHVSPQGRLHGSLLVSRGFGALNALGHGSDADRKLNQFGKQLLWTLQDSSKLKGFREKCILSAEADTGELVIEKTDECEFLVLASDGLFEKFGNQEVVSFVRDDIKKSRDVETTASNLVRAAQMADNTTALIIFLKSI